MARILELRAQGSLGRLRKSEGFVLPRQGRRFALFQTLRLALADFGRASGLRRHQPDLASPLAPHLGLGHAPLRDEPASLKELMGHKDIRMTLRYLKVTKPDLQREFYRARHNIAQPYSIPKRSPLLPPPPNLPESGTHSRLHATFWRFTGARSPTTRTDVDSSVSTDAYSTSINNSRRSQRPRNEERLAGQPASLHEITAR